jgi:hypothetical protein
MGCSGHFKPCQGSRGGGQSSPFRTKARANGLRIPQCRRAVGTYCTDSLFHGTGVHQKALSSRALSSRALSSRALSSPRAHSQRLKVQITRPKYPANRERLRQILARVRLLLAVAFVK